MVKTTTSDDTDPSERFKCWRWLGAHFRAAGTSDLVDLTTLASMLFLVCYQVWGIGITHTDDALWALDAYNLNSHPILDLANTQGRLWGFPIGKLLLHALAWQGTLYGELLKVGSFALFFVAFQSLVAIYSGRAMALLSGCFFLALLALRWDGSLLTAYPLLTWPSATIFILAVFAGRFYANSGASGALLASGVCLFASLFNNEGVSLLFFALFPLTVLVNEYQCASQSGRPYALLGAERTRLLLAAYVVAAAFYIALASLWAYYHPSTYNGHVLAKFVPAHIIAVLFHFATCGSVLHDFIEPYFVTYSDALTRSSSRIGYRTLDALPLVSVSPASLIFGAFSAISIFRAGARQDLFLSGRPGLIRICFAGVMAIFVAAVPLVPVAMTAKYQNWFYALGVRAYVETILAHFGIGLALAALTALGLRACGKMRILVLTMTTAVALSVGTLASLGFAENDVIATDMRVESGRWRVLAQVIALAQAAHINPPVIWAPRFASGSWFTVVPEDYWTQYARARFNRSVEIKTRGLPADGISTGFAVVDYRLLDDERHFITFLASAEIPDANTPNRAVVTRIAVASERAALSTLRRYKLIFLNEQNEEVQVSLIDLPTIGKQAGMRILEGVHAKPTSIRISEGSDISSLEILCPSEISIPTSIAFGTPAFSTGESCSGSKLLVSGWWAPEARGVWSANDKAELVLPALPRDTGAVAAIFDVSSYSRMGSYRGTQEVSVRVKDRVVATWAFTSDGAPPDTRVLIPADLRENDGRIRITFKLDAAVSSAKEGLSPDNRTLGVYMCGVKLIFADDLKTVSQPGRGCP